MTEGKSLREQLAQEAPELHAELLRCWKIADEEWLPAIKGNLGSHNGYPHLRGVEEHANAILAQVSQEDAPFGAVCLSSAEKFLLLAAILFHDLGRAFTESNGKKHGLRTKEALETNYAQYGLTNKRMAKAIGDICRYHTMWRPRTQRVVSHRGYH